MKKKPKYCPGHVMLKTFKKSKVTLLYTIEIPSLVVMDLLFNSKIRNYRWATMGYPEHIK